LLRRNTHSDAVDVEHAPRCDPKPAAAFGSAPDIPAPTAQSLANTCSCPVGCLQYEPMFVHMKKIPTKTADALDLAIEFATLGEYGLEYPETKRVNEHATACPGSARRRTPVPDGARRLRSAPCSTETTDFASALRPPRIKLSFAD